MQGTIPHKLKKLRKYQYEKHPANYCIYYLLPFDVMLRGKRCHKYTKYFGNTDNLV